MKRISTYSDGYNDQCDFGCDAPECYGTEMCVYGCICGEVRDDFQGNENLVRAFFEKFLKDSRELERKLENMHGRNRNYPVGWDFV